MSKRKKLCPGTRCIQYIEKKLFCCKFHWKWLTDDLRVGIIKGDAKKKYEAIQFLQGVQREKDQQKKQIIEAQAETV